MKRCMLDFETLGTRPGCVVLTFGAVFFDDEAASEPLGLKFSVACNVESQKKLGLHVDPATQAWWAKQSPEAQAGAADAYTAKAPKLTDVLELFTEYLRKQAGQRSVEIWGNGASFDNAILAALYHAAEKPLPWEFWNDRCYRTLKNLPGAPAAQKFVGTKHNALNDAVHQANHAVDILRHLVPKRAAPTPDHEDPADLVAPAKSRSPYKRKF